MELHGETWLTDSWQYIQEDKVEHYRMLMALAPLSRTPMDTKSAEAIEGYRKQLDKMFEDATPWRKRSSETVSKLSHLRSKYKSGEVVVILDAGDSPNDPLFEGADRITRE